MKYKKTFLIGLVTVTIFRIWIGLQISLNEDSPSPVDGDWMVSKQDLGRHFHNWDWLSLIKDLSSAVFMCFVKYTFLPYTFWYAILWVVCGVVSVFVVKKITNNKIILTFTYLFFVFQPSGLHRISRYREDLMAPTLLLLLLLAFGTLLCFVLERPNFKKILMWVIPFSVCYSYYFYMKEDGIWTYAILFVYCVLILIVTLKRFILRFVLGDKSTEIHPSKTILKSLSKPLVLILLPILTLGVVTTAYKSINYHYFGVYEVNTRTEGELMEFIKRVYKVESPSRTYKIWAPTDALQKVWAVSPTLQSASKLTDNFFNGENYFGPIADPNHQIAADFLGWSTQMALYNSDMYNNEAEVQEFFKQVNKEIDQAFNSGQLHKQEDRIAISSSGGSYTIDEINSITLPLFRKYIYEGATNNSINRDARSSYLPNCTPEATRICSKYVKTNVAIYQNVTPILFYVGLIITFLCLCFLVLSATIFRKCRDKFFSYEDTKKVWLSVGSSIGFLSFGLLYSFILAWFTTAVSFSSNYATVLYPMYALFEAMSLISLFLIGKQVRRRKSPDGRE